MYWKTKTIRGKFHMYFGKVAPNKNWKYYEPDVDTEKYYKKHAKLNDQWSVIEIREEDI